VLAKWVPYYVYRNHGTEWPEAPFHLIRLLFFVLLATVTTFAAGPGLLLNPTAAALLTWMVWRSRQEIRTALARAHRIDIPAAKGTP
jgi:Flp pilus assembly protein TadB